jgi:hypothetical protein
MTSKDYELGYKDAIADCLANVTDMFIPECDNFPETKNISLLILSRITHNLLCLLRKKFKDESNEQS